MMRNWEMVDVIRSDRTPSISRGYEMSTYLQEDLTSHPVTGYINSLTADLSKKTMLAALKAVLALALECEPSEVDPLTVYEFPWHGLDVGKLSAIKAGLIEKYSMRHAAKCFSAVKGVLGACFDQDLINAQQFMKIKRIKGVSVNSAIKTGRKLTIGEITALAQVCAQDQSPAGARDDAIIGIGYTQGPRISEIVNMRIEDYDSIVGDIVVKNAKGNKDRTIRGSNSVRASVDEWIGLRGIETGPLFTRINKGGKIKIAPVSSAALSKMITKRAHQAGVKHFTFHDLRRTFITNGWSIGIPGTQLQTIAGHASISTTASYDRTDVDVALKSCEKLHYPSQRHI
jgi:integrase